MHDHVNKVFGYRKPFGWTAMQKFHLHHIIIYGIAVPKYYIHYEVYLGVESASHSAECLPYCMQWRWRAGELLYWVNHSVRVNHVLRGLLLWRNAGH